MLASTGELGGAFAQRKGSWMIAGRRTYADKFVKLINPSNELPYHFRPGRYNTNTPSTCSPARSTARR